MNNPAPNPESTPHEQPAPEDVARRIRKRLSDFFPAAALDWKPQAVSGTKALAIAYIDARAVMKRLDDVLGIDGWQDSYLPVDDGSVICTLRCRICGEWVTKTDVGGESDQKDASDRKKAAFSDALKRAAVKFGVGRYLYSLPSQWVDYDPQKRHFVRVPTVGPEWLPKREKTPAPQPAPDAPQAPANAAPSNGRLPADGAELEARLVKHEQALVAAGRCVAGDLFAHVFRQYDTAFGTAGNPVPPVVRWPKERFPMVTDWVRAFDALHPAEPATATPPAPAPVTAPAADPYPAPKITPVQVDALNRLLEQKGRKWSLVREVFDLPKMFLPPDLTPFVYAGVMRALNEEKDAPTARK